MNIRKLLLLIYLGGFAGLYSEELCELPSEFSNCKEYRDEVQSYALDSLDFIDSVENEFRNLRNNVRKDTIVNVKATGTAANLEVIITIPVYEPTFEDKVEIDNTQPIVRRFIIKPELEIAVRENKGIVLLTGIVAGCGFSIVNGYEPYLGFEAVGYSSNYITLSLLPVVNPQGIGIGLSIRPRYSPPVSGFAGVMYNSEVLEKSENKIDIVVGAGISLKLTGE